MTKDITKIVLGVIVILLAIIVNIPLASGLRSFGVPING